MRAKFGWLLAGLWLASIAGWAAEREASPAVVNPVWRSALRHTISLDGLWDFATDPAGVGERERWFDAAKALPNRIALQVPGCWEAQGVSGPGNSTTVTPERSIRPLRGSYTGTAWYRKELTLPESWKGKRIWLKIGGVHAQGWFWLNGTYLGHNQCYCGTYKYDVTDLVKPGERVAIAAKVRNDVPSGKGLFSWIQRFGGLYRSVELEATSGVLIDDAYVAGELDKGGCIVHAKIRFPGPNIASGPPTDLQVNIATGEGQSAGRATLRVPPGTNLTVDVAIPLSLAPFLPWSPEEPNLYRAELVLKAGNDPIDGWSERFGVRKWEVRGGDFYLNNRKHFVRGYGDDFVYPLTLVSPASRDIHRRHLQLARSYGFTYVRHHTHCELPEFYEAADELGIMIQPELPYYGSTPSAGAPGWFQPQKDLTELYTHYRRYVSLSTYCTGNEGHLGTPVDREVYQLAKKIDPSRLALHQDGGNNRKNNSDFHQGPVLPWKPGTQDASWPFTAHEYLNLATDEDPRLASKYTGAVLPPVEPEQFRASLNGAGLSWDWGIATIEAGNQLQAIYQKRGLEQARLDPACDGYIFWTLIDVGSPSAQGLFNQFWEPKASTAAYFRQFNSPAALLARFDPPERILRAGQELKIDWWISGLPADRGEAQRLRWRLETGGKVVGSGDLAPFEIESGEARTIGQTRIQTSAVLTPAKYQLVAELTGTEIKNSWDLWIFPRRSNQADGKGLAAAANLHRLLRDRYPALAAVDTIKPESARVLLTERFDSRVVEALEQGKTVLLLRLPGIAPGVEPGWWSPGKQTGTAIAHHPAFGDFPHDGYLNELWFRLLGRTVSPTDEALHRLEPLMVGRGSAGYLLHVFQAKSGRGKLLASGLNLLSDNPEAEYLLDHFIAYVTNSARFEPKGELDPHNLGKNWQAAVDLTQALNGWAETFHAAERRQYGSFLGEYPMAIARQTDGASSVVWRTRTVPADLAPEKLHTFTWVAGLGYMSEPAGKFTLFLGDRLLLELGASQTNTTWRGGDDRVSLKYTAKSRDSLDSSGLMELTVPGSMLKPGESAQLRIVGSKHRSQRWFGLYETNGEQ